jgi:[ribosomal protein S5]-alanine N-acetyltransferase
LRFGGHHPPNWGVVTDGSVLTHLLFFAFKFRRFFSYKTHFPFFHLPLHLTFKAPDIMTPAPESDRLRLVPLTYELLQLYVRGEGAVDAALGLIPVVRVIDAHFKGVLEEIMLPNLADGSKNFLYHTLWSVVLKSENHLVADISIKGEPNEAGEVELGYGTYEAYQNHGYMSEAVGALINWFKTEPAVKYVTASTLKDNAPSVKVLEKNAFVKIREDEKYFYWSLML